MKNNDIHQIVEILRQDVPKWKTPAVTVVAGSRNPFYVLISCILSLRTKDEATATAFARLKQRACTPQSMLKIPPEELAQIIYPVGFYNQKAKTIHEICQTLLEKYDGKVPDTVEELIKFKGVGRKTANLVVTLGYNLPGICVDVHVHRICNRWTSVAFLPSDLKCRKTNTFQIPKIVGWGMLPPEKKTARFRPSTPGYC